MADLGDIGGILNETHVSDLDWLDVDEEEYRASEKLPKQNLDAVPELVEQWGRLSEEDQYRLHPENRTPENPNTSFWSERSTPGELSSEDAAAIVEKFAKRHVQAGVAGKDLISILKRNFDSRVLKASKEAVRGVLEERGLLGSVYIDSELFEDCYKGGPQEGLTANNKSAKFVLAKSDCSDCIHNREGRCSVFQKELVFDVEYTQNLWEEYEGHLEAQGKDLSGVQGLPVKARLQKALLASPAPTAQALDGKPIVADPTEGVTYEEARERLLAADVKQEVIRNHYGKRKIRRVAMEMMQGNHSSYVRDLIASDLALSPLENKLHLLGQLYLDLSYLPTYKAASEFIDSLGEQLPPLIVGVPYEEKELDSRYAQAARIDLTSDRALLHTVSRYFLTKFGHTLDAKKKSVFKKLFAKLQKMDEESVRKFAQGVYAKPVPQKVRQYEATVIYDPTEGITSEEADRRLDAAENKRVVVENPTKIANRQDVVGRMLRGDHGSKVATLLLNDERMDGLYDHLHLLGKLYVDTSLASPRAVEAASMANPEVKELPLLTPNNRDGFFEKPEVHAVVAKRVAKLKGIDKDPHYTKLLRKVVDKLSSVSGEKVKAFARKAFSTPVKKKVATHQTPYQINPRVEVTDEQVHDFMESLKGVKQARAFDTLEDYLMEEGGKELLSALQDRMGLDRIKRLYLSNDGKVASNLASSKTAQNDAMEILSAVLADNYEPSGLRSPSAKMARTKMGRWLRDQMMKGRYGKELAEALKVAYSYSELLDQAPVVVAYREEEGLYGRAYSTADSYDDCTEGTRKISNSVQQIVKGSKCDGCIYNKIGRCLLYSKTLTDQPEYSEDTVNAALNYRVGHGQLTERDAQKIRALDVDPKTKTRIAHTAEPSNEVQEHTSGLQAYYGDQSERMGNHDAVRQVVEKRAKQREEALETIESSSDGGALGTDQMADFELDGANPGGPLNDFEFHDGPAPSMDVEFGDGFNIE
jgi:hypothetical protein